MSLHDAASLDESDKLVAKDVEVAAEARDVYLSPVFKVGREHVHQELGGHMRPSWGSKPRCSS
jgi:hypothetical protein